MWEGTHEEGTLWVSPSLPITHLTYIFAGGDSPPISTHEVEMPGQFQDITARIHNKSWSGRNGKWYIMTADIDAQKKHAVFPRLRRSLLSKRAKSKQ